MAKIELLSTAAPAALPPSSLPPSSAPVPEFAAVDDWCALSGMSRTNTYYALGRGDLKAKKLGKRTLIIVRAGLAWLASLPDAAFVSPKATAVLRDGDLSK